MPEYEFEWEQVRSGTVTVEAEDADTALDFARDEVRRSSGQWCDHIDLSVWPYGAHRRLINE